MVIEERVEQLYHYIKSLGNFEIKKWNECEEIKKPYKHMGAIITDAILQAGIDWCAVVLPCLKEILKYQEAKTITGFLRVLEKEGVGKLLRWKGKKPDLVVRVARFFADEKNRDPRTIKRRAL